MPSREPPDRFPVSFYVVAMLFVMFDIEIVFLYPYAVERATLGAFGFWAIVVFSVIFFLTFVYEVARGGLDWGPLHEYRRLDRDAAMVSPDARLVVHHPAGSASRADRPRHRRGSGIHT